MFDLEKVPSNSSSNEFSICACYELEALKIKETEFVNECDNFNFELVIV